MSLLIDIIVIVAFAVSLAAGIKKGFLKSVMRVLIVVLALIGAINFTPDLSRAINDKWLEKPITDLAENSIRELISETVDIDDLADERPNAFVKALGRFGVTPDDIEVFVAEDTDGDSKITRIAEYMASPVSKAISKVVAFVALFFGLLLIFWLISLVVCLVVKLPKISKADKVLGGILGAVSGVMLAWGISVAICELMPHMAIIFDEAVSETVVDNSVIVKWLGAFDPFSVF